MYYLLSLNLRWQFFSDFESNLYKFFKTIRYAVHICCIRHVEILIETDHTACRIHRQKTHQYRTVSVC